MENIVSGTRKNLLHIKYKNWRKTNITIRARSVGTWNTWGYYQCHSDLEIPMNLKRHVRHENRADGQ